MNKMKLDQDYQDEVNKTIENVKNGLDVYQYMAGEFYWMLTFFNGDFYLRKHSSLTDYVISVELVSEDVARFSLT